MKTTVLVAASAAALCASVLVAADARAWGLHDGEGIGTDDNLIYGEAGFPGFGIGYARGLKNDHIEVGARFDVRYGLDSTPQTNLFVNSFGIGFAGTLRYTIRRDEKLSVEVHVAPGIRFDSFKPTYFGLQIPFGVEAGRAVAKNLFATGGVDFDVFGDLSKEGYFVFAPMGGPGVEYHVSEHITLGGITRFGAAIVSGPQTLGGTQFAFRTQAFFGYRM